MVKKYTRISNLNFQNEFEAHQYTTYHFY